MGRETAESVARKLAETTEAMRRCRIDAPEYSALYWEKRRLKDAMRRVELGGAKARQGEETAGNPSGPSGHHSGACRPVLTGNSPPDCFPGVRTPFRGGNGVGWMRCLMLYDIESCCFHRRMTKRRP